MSDFDLLELELAAMLPHEPSAELKQRVASRLAEAGGAPLAQARSVWREAALVGGLLAASLMAVFAWQRDPQLSVSPSAAGLEVDVATAFDQRLPSLWVYHRAVSQPASLDRLLDRHASRRHEPSTAAFVVARSTADFETLTGEL